MAKIPFDIKYRPQIESGEYKVETRDGKPVRIICFDAPIEDYPIIGVSDDPKDDPFTFTEEGKYICEDDQPDSLDLFIITPEEELNEFEKAIKEMMRSYVKMPDEVIKETAAELLDLATKETGHKWIIRQESYQDGYINGLHDGKAEALKDLPRWKKICRGNNYSSETKFTINGRHLEMNDTLNDVYEVSLSDLEKLPKED